MTATLLTLHVLNVALWSVAFGLLVLPCVRLIRGRSRYLDPLWAVCMLGVCNRLATTILTIPEIIADTATILLAAAFSLIVLSYQHADK